MMKEESNWCEYSDLPSPMAYMETGIEVTLENKSKNKVYFKTEDLPSVLTTNQNKFLRSFHFLRTVKENKHE